MPIFANPLGLLALLGIPAVLAIHFLQRKAVELPVSTLFLLERARRDAASGRRFERIVPSIPLWMQLLAVLLLAWFLAEPRFRNATSVRRVAVVLDSSASMQVFKQEAVARLLREIPAFQGPAGRIELTVLESAPDRPRLYTGSSLPDLTAAMEKWRPLDGLIDPTAALRLARSLVSSEGAVLYLTDTPAASLPFDARLVAVGEPVENVGFTGVSFASVDGTPVWRAIVRNYGKTAADRTWELRIDGGGSAPKPLHLEAGTMVTLQAAFPAGAKHVRVALSPDRFTLDDQLPLVLPKPKTLALFDGGPPAFAELTTRLLRSIDGMVSTQDSATADLALAFQHPPAGNAVVFAEDASGSGKRLSGGIVAERHPLMDNLNWQSLLVREAPDLERLPSDTVLLWQDKRPLVFLRETPAGRRLCLNFDLRTSNALQQPAFIVLLHRFAESIRDAKIAPTAAMLETSQPIHLTAAPGIPLQTAATDLSGHPLPSAQATGKAPAEPGFLTIRQQETVLLAAAVFFADTREADFSACGRSESATAPSAAATSRLTRPDPFWRVGLLFLIAALLVSWKFTNRPLPA